MFTFKDIIGYDDLKDHLRTAIKQNKMAHAYILEGAEGSGKKLVANTIAKTLQCENQGEEPCDTCVSCQTFDNFNHPDVFYVKPMKKKSIGVDDIRSQIQESIQIKPYKYPYKIYIIDQADLLTEQAQNALLKTIEEPPPYAMLFLLSKNRNSFLPTIRSRCVLLQLPPISQEKIRDYLIRHKEIPDYQAKLYTQFSSGTIGQAIKLSSSEEFIAMRKDITELLHQLNKMNTVDRMNKVSVLEGYKTTIVEVLNLMVVWFRDVLFYKEFGDESKIMNMDQLDAIQQYSQLSYSGILHNIKLIEDTKKQLRHNTNFRLTMEILLLNLK